MTSIVDSNAHFLKRGCRCWNVSRGHQPIGGGEFEYFGKAGFLTTWTAGYNICSKHFGRRDQQADTGVLKRLVFEGHTLVLGQLRELVTDPNAAASRKLPAVEREHRMQQLKACLAGVVIERQLEPSDELLEAMMQQKECNQLNYGQIERCASREWEITMEKSRSRFHWTV